MSEGALYRHFVSKEQLVWLLFERHYVEFAGRLHGAGATPSRRRAESWPR